MNKFRVAQVDHVELFVPDRREAAEWYERVLGLAVVAGLESWADDPAGPLMLTTAEAGTKLALFAGGPPGSRETAAFHRVAFRVSPVGFDALLAWVRNHPVFGDQGEEVRELSVRDHGAARSVYFRDPYGHRLEVTTYGDGGAITSDLGAAVTIRASTPDDAPGLCACVDAVARERRYLASVRGFTVEETRAFLAGLTAGGGVQCIAVADGVVVGWCDVASLPFEGMRHVGRLGMGLLPTHRGRGLGTRLLREVLNLAFARGLTRVELEVFASNAAAVRLYEREGFLAEGRKRRARILDGAEDDLLVMALVRDEGPGAGS